MSRPIQLEGGKCPPPPPGIEVNMVMKITIRPHTSPHSASAISNYVQHNTNHIQSLHYKSTFLHSIIKDHTSTASSKWLSVISAGELELVSFRLVRKQFLSEKASFYRCSGDRNGEADCIAILLQLGNMQRLHVIRNKIIQLQLHVIFRLNS